MSYQCSVLIPESPDSIDKGVLSKAEVLAFFQNYDWHNELRKFANMPDEDIHYSPSLKIEDTTSNRWLELSAVGDPFNYIFYLFYQRPKEVKKWFGLVTAIDDHFVTQILDVPVEKAEEIIELFLNGRWVDLEAFFD